MRAIRSGISVVIGLLALTYAVAPAHAADQRPPNIVLIMADDLGAEQLGCYGHPRNQTPHLDRLARSGTLFRTCWATPLCSPSRVELMTGRYGFRTGWYNLIGSPYTPGDRIDPDEITFADVLKQAGYATGLAGKWQLGSIIDHPTMIVDSGFDEYFSWAWKSLPAGAKFEGTPRHRYWRPAIVENGRHRPTTSDDYGPDLCSGWIIDFIKRHRDRPFLAYYPMCLVHEPWDPTPDPSQPGGRTKGGLQANVEYMDQVVGRIIAALDELGLRDNTVVLFTGDNGTGRAGKGKVIEAGVHVPMIVSGPGVKAGQVTDALIDFSDVLPTLAELTGARLPAGVRIDGHSFAPILRAEEVKGRDWIFSFLGPRRMIRDRRWLLEGDGRLFDCGDRRDTAGCRDVTDSNDPQVAAARERLTAILRDLPAPAPGSQASRPAGARRDRPRAQ